MKPKMVRCPEWLECVEDCEHKNLHEKSGDCDHDGDGVEYDYGRCESCLPVKSVKGKKGKP